MKNSAMYAKVNVAIAIILLCASKITAEDGYEIIRDFEGYQQATIPNSDEYLWLSSDWIRSVDNGNWHTNPTTDRYNKDNATFLVYNSIVYTGGQWDDNSLSVIFQRHDAENGERLDDMVIDLSDAAYNNKRPINGHICLHKDDAGAIYMIGAMGHSRITEKVAPAVFYLVDVETSMATKCIEVSGYKKQVGSSYDENGNAMSYPVISGDIKGGNYYIWGVSFNWKGSTGTLYECVYTHETQPATYTYNLNQKFALSNTPRLTPITDGKTTTLLMDAPNMEPHFIYISNHRLGQNTSLFPNPNSSPLEAEYGGTSNGVSLLKHHGIKLLGLSSFIMPNENVDFSLVYYNGYNDSYPIYDSTFKNYSSNQLMWTIPERYSTLQQSNKGYTYSNMQTIPTEGNATKLYVCASGHGVAAYTIIGPGRTTGLSNIDMATAAFDIAGNVLRLNRASDVSIYNTLGQLVIHSIGARTVSLSGLPQGLYIAMDKNGNILKFIR